MKKLICLLLALLMPAAACAQTLTLPSGVIDIAQEAFRGDESITEAIIPDGALTIGAGAFADCSALGDVTIPSSVLSIGAEAFDGCEPTLLIRTKAGSAAMQYAASNLIDYQADTTYRALLIGQCAYDSPLTSLNGPANDIVAMEKALSLHPDTPYICDVRQDLKRDEIISAISEAFAGAKAQDVSLFYYSGHGASQGRLVGIDRYPMTPASLRTYLDKIPGRKIVIVDACNSGAIIGKSADTAESFVESFVAAFSAKTRSNLATDGYYVITASHSTQDSVEIQTSSGLYYGLFTYHLVNGLGWNYLSKVEQSLLADADANGVVSIEEAYQYAKNKAQAKWPDQVAQVYPDNCVYHGLVRK